MAMVRRCDMCGGEIRPLERLRFRLRKARMYEAAFFDVPGKQWEYDLCDNCAKAVMEFIKRGGMKNG